MLWVDKHRPKTLDDLSYHDATTDRLKALASTPDTLPHLLFYGPPGSGKKTRIMALLRTIYGPGAHKLKLDKRSFTTPTKRTIEVNLVTSNYHIEMSPGDAGLDDRYVVQEIIKEMASNRNINAKSSTVDFKILVLSEVDRLSRQAQAALRRTMEKYAQTCRLILVANSASKVMDPVRSRCLGIRIGAPTEDEICHVLQSTSGKEKVDLPDQLAISLARESSRNLRRALLMLEACRVQHRDSPQLPADMAIPLTDWELYIKQLALDITKEQSPQRLLVARDKLYELLVNCIPATVILKTLVGCLIINLDDALKHQVVEWAAFYEHRLAMSSSNKEIFHLEAFVCKYMALYKKYLTEMFG